MRNDPEYAEWIASQPETPGKKWRPPATEWSTTEDLLAAAVDRLGVVATLLGDMPMAQGLKRHSKPPASYPRPSTAIEQARARRNAQVENDLDDLIDAAHATYEAEQQGSG